ncbi:MAG: Hsp20/alpha crystallin family protein [Actinomycetes bacterium]
MSVMRFDPFGDPFRQMDRLTSQLLSGTRTPMGMPMDVWQADDGYHVALDLPGVDPSTVDITCERNMLTIRAERRAEYGQAQNVVVAERPQGTFTRQLQVGDALDTSKVDARYDNGVLLLTIPVAQSAQPRKIQVQRGQSGQQIDVTSGERPEQSERSERSGGRSS